MNRLFKLTIFNQFNSSDKNRCSMEIVASIEKEWLLIGKPVDMEIGIGKHDHNMVKYQIGWRFKKKSKFIFGFCCCWW